MVMDYSQLIHSARLAGLHARPMGVGRCGQSVGENVIVCMRLHALGFPCAWESATAAAVARLAVSSRRIGSCEAGSYTVWRSLDGAELWFHFPRLAGERPSAAKPGPPTIEGLRAITPFHRGLSRVDLVVERRLGLDPTNPLEGSFRARFPAGRPNTADQTLNVEMVPYALQPIARTPVRAAAQIACFAHAVWAFDSTQHYLERTPKHRRLLAGSFGSVTQEEVPDVKLDYVQSVVSLGLMTGTVQRAIRHRNPLTGMSYYWLQLATRRGAFDIIANPLTIEGDISMGQTAQVCGSFVGRLIVPN